MAVDVFCSLKTYTHTRARAHTKEMEMPQHQWLRVPFEETTMTNGEIFRAINGLKVVKYRRIQLFMIWHNERAREGEIGESKNEQKNKN